jgi:hypothetical protein
VWPDKFSASGEKDCGRRDLSAENQAEDSGLKNSTLVAQAIAVRAAGDYRAMMATGVVCRRFR